MIGQPAVVAISQCTPTRYQFIESPHLCHADRRLHVGQAIIETQHRVSLGHQIASRVAIAVAGVHAVLAQQPCLLGHLHNLCRASGVGAEIDAAAVPAIDGVRDLLADADEQAVSGGSRRNREYAASFTTVADGVPDAHVRLVCDATTSGGLLVALPEDRAGDVPGAVVGRVVAGEPGTILVR